MSNENNQPEIQHFRMDEIVPFYPPAVDEASLPNAKIGLPENQTIVTRQSRRTALELVRTRSATRTIERLPLPGESLHCVLRGDFSLFDFLLAVVELTDEPIERLHVVTLSMSHRNVERLEELVVAGRIQDVKIICSCYHAAADAKIFQHASEFCARHGSPLVPLRSHAKMLAVAVGDRRLIVESSANLRSCKNIENAVLYDDAELYRFHTAWMDSLIARGRHK